MRRTVASLTISDVKVGMSVSSVGMHVSTVVRGKAAEDARKKAAFPEPASSLPPLALLAAVSPNLFRGLLSEMKAADFRVQRTARKCAIGAALAREVGLVVSACVKNVVLPT